MTQITNGTMKELSKYYIFFICAIPVNSRNLSLQPHDLFLKCVQAPKIIIEEGEALLVDQHSMKTHKIRILCP